MSQECKELIDVWRKQAEELRCERGNHTWSNHQVGSILRTCASQLEKAILKKRDRR